MAGEPLPLSHTGASSGLQNSKAPASSAAPSSSSPASQEHEAGASSGPRKRKAPASSAAPSSSSSPASEEHEAGPAAAQQQQEEEEEEEDDEESLEELESEVADLGRRIVEHRRAAAGRVLDAVVSSLKALRPPIFEVPTQLQSLTETSVCPEILEKLDLLKSKTEAAISALPKVLKSVDESTSRVEKLDNLNRVNIDPVFRRKRLEKLELLKSKTEATIAALPKVFKSVDETTSRVEKLDNLNVNIHPVFRRKR
ncbi:hypothetical protein ACP4OV_004163 [Aristida adscensionis]